MLLWRRKNAKEESIDNYIDLFFEYKENPPTLKEALNQLFISGGVPENELNEYIEDILRKVNKVLDDSNRKVKIKNKYPKIILEDAQIITSYTCEAKKCQFNPYIILNKNLVSDDRKQGIQNVSKYFYILLMALRRLPRYYPGKQLYRCIKKKVDLYDQFNKNYVPYVLGNEKTFWAFTSTSLNSKTSYKFLGKSNSNDEFKTGTVFSLSGNIWGYDITVLSYYPKEEEILLEPERKYIIKEIYPELNDIIIIRGEFKDTSIVLKDMHLTNELIYNSKYDGYFYIFHYKFVEININNIDVIVNGEEKKLSCGFYLHKGENKVKILKKNKITNLSLMFSGIDKDITLNIESLRNLDISEVNSLAYMFQDCLSLTNISGLLRWKVSKVKCFAGMFFGCKSLSNINGLQKWDVSNANNFEAMFYDCEVLSDIEPLQNWNVSNGNNFGGMFQRCKSLSNINALHNWNVSNGISFNCMFKETSLSNLKPLQEWDVSNINNFEGMFIYCESLSDINALKNWNVSNGIIFNCMFYGCKSLSDIQPLKNWNIRISNELKIECMFYNSAISESDKDYFRKKLKNEFLCWY